MSLWQCDKRHGREGKNRTERKGEMELKEKKSQTAARGYLTDRT